MRISRRNFVRSAGLTALAAGFIEWHRGWTATVLANELTTLPATDHIDELYKKWIVIDALSGARLGEEGFAEIKKSSITMIDTTLGALGDPAFTYEQAVQDLATWHRSFDSYPDQLIRVRTAKDILQAKQEGKFAIMLGFQNATHLKRDINNVEFFYNLGIRQMLLTYNSLNSLGAGCTERKDVGLSDFGVKVVEKMNEVGMLVDLAHCGVQTTLDAIEVSKKPVLFTHNNCRALTDNPRCKTDEEIRKLAAKGGVMGVSTVNFFVSKKERSTLDDYIAHIEHVVKLVGIDHVGIGSDSPVAGWKVAFPTEKAFMDFHFKQLKIDFKPGVDIRWPPFIEEIDVPEKILIIAKRLSQRGFSDSDIEKIVGGNFLRVYQEVLG